MEKAIIGMERIDRGIADQSLVFNKKTAEQYAGVAKQMHDVHTFASAEDRVVLDALDAISKKNEAILKQHGTLQDGGDYIAHSNIGDNTRKAFQEAKTEFVACRNKVAAFCRGERIEGFEHTASDAFTKAFTEAEHAANKLVGKTTHLFSVVHTQEGGWSKAFKTNTASMNGFKEGLTGIERAKAFGRGSVVVGSAIAVGDALLRSKDSEGEDRSTSFRVVEAVAAGLVGGTALLQGRAMARL